MGGASLLRPVGGLPCGEGSVLESGVLPETIYTRIQGTTYQSWRPHTAGNSGTHACYMTLYCSVCRRGEGGVGKEMGEEGRGKEGGGRTREGRGKRGEGRGRSAEGRGRGGGGKRRGEGPTFTPGVSSSNSFSTPSSNTSSSSGATLTAARDPSAVQGKGGGVGVVTTLYPTNFCTSEVSQSVQLDNISTRHHIGHSHSHSHTIHTRIMQCKAESVALVIPLVEADPTYTNPSVVSHHKLPAPSIQVRTCDHKSITCCVTHCKDYGIAPTHYYDYTALCLQFC